jgi:signal peptidase II
VFLDNAPIGSPTRWFHGQVIDMLFFPVAEFVWPAWVPGIGGDYFLFFSPVFNIADSSIFLGVATILLFQKRFFKETEEENKSAVEPPPSEVQSTETDLSSPTSSI